MIKIAAEIRSTETAVRFTCFSPVDQNKHFANSADSDETARYEPSHLDLHCSPFCFQFCNDTPLFAKMDMPDYKMQGTILDSQGWNYIERD